MDGGGQPRFCGWLFCSEPQRLKDNGTLFKVAEGLKGDGSYLHTKTCPLRLVAFFILTKQQIDPDPSLLVGRHTVYIRDYY